MQDLDIEKINLREIVCSIIALIPFVVELGYVDINKSGIFAEYFLDYFRASIVVTPLQASLIFCFMIFVFIKTSEERKSGEGGLRAISVLYSIILICGKSYQEYSSGVTIFMFCVPQFIKVVLSAAGYYLVIYRLLYLIKCHYSKKYNIIFGLSNVSEYVFYHKFLILLLMYLPIYILNYPGITAWDTGQLLKNYFENGIIDNGVPAFQSYIYIIFLKLGKRFLGEYGYGIGIYTFCQMMASIVIICYALNTLEGIKVSKKYLFIILLIFGILPVFSYASIQMGSDVTYTLMLLLYNILLIKVMHYKEASVCDIFLMVLSLLLASLFRHTGIYMAIISLAIIVFQKIGNYEKLAMAHITIIAVYYAWSIFIIPHIVTDNIFNTQRAVLIHTYQQISNYIYNDYEDISAEEYERLSEFVDIEQVKERYNPEISDEVWDLFHVQGKDTIQYLVLWIKIGLKHPLLYLQASNNMWYGYFYPDFRSTVKPYMWHMLTNITDSKLLDVHYMGLAARYHHISEAWWILLYQIPIVGMMFSIGYYVWILIYSVYMLIRNHDKKKLLLFMPAIVTLAICMVSPCNGYTRYAYPIMYTTPFVFAYIIGVRNNHLGKLKHNENIAVE